MNASSFRYPTKSRTRLGTRVLVACASLTVWSPVIAQGEARLTDTPRFSEQYLTTPDGVRLYARVYGSGTHTVIVHAAAHLARDLARLADDRTIIFYDNRSRGASDTVTDPEMLGLDFELSDLEAVRDHFGVGNVSLIGWSYFGAIVARYAAAYPEHVRSVVQISPVAPRTELSTVSEQRGAPPDPDDIAYMASLAESGMATTDPVGLCREGYKRITYPRMMGRKGVAEAIARSQSDPCLYWNERLPAYAVTLGHLFPESLQWDYSEEAARIRAPVLTIHGTDDPNAPIEGGREWVALIPNARLVELDGVGHVPHLEAPDEFFAAVDAFLRSN